MPAASRVRTRVLGREPLVFLAFLALTVAMTWPWAKHLRDHCSDAGDPYLNSWILWWDWHQTFHDPLHLFDGNIFFPYKLSLAFSEHNYGLALPLFPLFALGLRPLTAQSLLTLLGFAFSGYGAFRLGRTLTGSTGAAWVAGVAFAFVPYRFGHLPHVNYLFAGWIPIVFEALVLFLRERSPRRAAWLGAAFFLNGLSVIHWLVLTLVPLAAVALVLAYRSGVEGDRAGWKRGALAVGAAGIALLPFLLPYQRAAKLYGFTRGIDETRNYSAQLRDWMNADPHDRLWAGFSEFPTPFERALFPGFLLLAFPLAALLLLPPLSPSGEAPAPGAGPVPDPRVLGSLDAAAVISGFLALFAGSPAGIHVRLAGREVFRATEPWRAFAVFAVVLAVRWWFAYPAALPLVKAGSLKESLRSIRRPDAIVVGALLALLGFFGSFGVRFPFHRLLYETIFLFRSIRAPARWAMIAYLGLAILAGAGVLAVAEAWKRRRPGARAPAVFVLACAALLFEDRAAPLDLVRGEADPDEVTLFLAKTPMNGGIVELPSGGEDLGNYRAVLRAADHGKPLVTAVSGFPSPIVSRIEEDERKAPIPEDFLDFLEGIPTSYVLVHEPSLSPEMKSTHRAWIDRALASGRLVFVKRFDGARQNDLFAVAKNEPAVRALEPLPWSPPAGLTPQGALWREDASLTGSVDVPAEGAAVKGPLLVAGWARIPGEDLDVTVLLDGEARTPVSSRRLPRPGVCAAVPGLGDCSAAGYEATLAFRAGDAGPHEITALFRSKDGRERHIPAEVRVGSGPLTRRPLTDRSKNLLTLGVTTLASLLVLEVVCRVLVARRTPPGMLFEDSVLYTLAPRTRIQGMVLNDVGCIGDDALPRDTGGGLPETRVLLLGGSTSFSARYVSAVKGSLEAAHPGLRFRVMSCGRPRYTSWVNRVNFERNGALWAPDVVVFYEGINDNIYNSFPWLEGEPSVGYFDARSLRSSVLLDLLRYYVVDKGLRSVPDFESKPLRSPRIFEESVRGIVALARQRNARAVLATFAIAWPTTDEALRARIHAEEPVMRHFWGNLPSTVAGVEAHERVIESLAKSLDLPLARVAEAMPHDAAHFGDLCHLTDAGNDILGAVVARAIPVEPPR